MHRDFPLLVFPGSVSVVRKVPELKRGAEERRRVQRRKEEISAAMDTGADVAVAQAPLAGSMQCAKEEGEAALEGQVVEETCVTGSVRKEEDDSEMDVSSNEEGDGEE